MKKIKSLLALLVVFALALGVYPQVHSIAASKSIKAKWYKSNGLTMQIEISRLLKSDECVVLQGESSEEVEYSVDKDDYILTIKGEDYATLYKYAIVKKTVDPDTEETSYTVRTSFSAYTALEEEVQNPEVEYKTDKKGKKCKIAISWDTVSEPKLGVSYKIVKNDKKHTTSTKTVNKTVEGSKRTFFYYTTKSKKYKATYTIYTVYKGKAIGKATVKVKVDRATAETENAEE